MQQSPYDRTMAYALRLLTSKPRSTEELRARLEGRADKETIERVIIRLVELGYLNDEQLAASFAAARLAIKPFGRTRLRRDLQRRKISSEIAEQALDQAYDEMSEETLIDRAIAKRVQLRGVPQTRAESKKLFDHLLRRGFNYELVLRKVRALNRLPEID